MMNLDRRRLLMGAALTSTGVLAAGGAGAQTPPAAAMQPVQAPGPEDPLTTRARKALRPIAFADGRFSGAGWDLIVEQGRAAEFVLLGEDHGMAEIPVLAREMFAALRPAGFDRLALEVSAPIAQDLDKAARTGTAGLKAFYDAHPPGVAFYNWKPEAEFLAAVRQSVPGKEQAIWGLDYAVVEDRRLIERLWAANPPASARGMLQMLDDASRAAWKNWENRADIGALYTFSGDPKVVEVLRVKWPKPSPEAALILETLEETLAINQLMKTSNSKSNLRRVALMRRNLLRQLAADQKGGRKTKLMVKIGAYHATRGVNQVGMFDIGSLLPEIAAMRGGHSFNVMVVGGSGALQGQLDPKTLGVTPAPVESLKELGLGALVPAIPTTGLVLLDLKGLRPWLTGETLKDYDPRLVQFVYGYDALLIWNGATATTML